MQQSSAVLAVANNKPVTYLTTMGAVARYASTVVSAINDLNIELSGKAGASTLVTRVKDVLACRGEDVKGAFASSHMGSMAMYLYAFFLVIHQIFQSTPLDMRLKNRW